MELFNIQLPHMPNLIKRILLLVLVLLPILNTNCSDSTRTKATETQKKQKPARRKQPNIVLIYVDDADCELVFSTWPAQNAETIRFPTLKKLAKNGMTFANFHSTTPVCGPSRACLLSGQYCHRNQVRVNDPTNRNANGFSGGFRAFDQSQELGIWMKDAGYYTTWVGKYLHHNFVPDPEKHETWKSILPSGWDLFISMKGAKYFDFAFLKSSQHNISKNNKQYRTDFEVEQICNLLERKSSITDKPFFICWAPIAPHFPPEGERMSLADQDDLFTDIVPMGVRDIHKYANPRTQPEPLASIPQYSSEALHLRTLKYQNQLRAMQAVDQGLGKIIDTLRSEHQLDNTIIIFTSDHGSTQGQFRHFGKWFPHDRITKVPFLVSGPGVERNTVCRQLLANIDIAPTLVEIANGNIPGTTDGISFAYLLREPNAKISRAGILIESWEQTWCNGVHINSTYCSMRTSNKIYTQWATGFCEYYDLSTDPEQFNNLFPKLSDSERNALLNQMNGLRSKNCNQAPVLSREDICPMVRYVPRKIISGSLDPVEFSGIVESDLGLESVKLEIYCKETGCYWDGHNWSEDFIQLNANLAIVHGHISNWSYLLDSSEIAFDENEKRTSVFDIAVNVIAIDRNLQQTRWNNAFEGLMRTDDPETWFDTPAPWTDKCQPLRLTGKAADNVELSRVEIVVLDKERNRYWDEQNHKWVQHRSTTNATLHREENTEARGDRARWSYDFTGPHSSDLYISARAYDNKNNYDGSVALHIEELKPPNVKRRQN